MRWLPLVLVLLVAAGCDDDLNSKPDLVVQEVAVSNPTPVASQTVTLTFGITNQGDIDAGAFTWRLDRSGSGTIREERYGGVWSNHTSDPIVVSLNEAAGTYTYTIVLDALNEVDEDDDDHIGEANNMTTVTITFSPAGSG
ncbi:MAG: hypothetical protein PF961_16545 [Planctomycetota bacterium]|jgi:hypothetical protein|nr:hypothetical protein [Planctomycetota bacterium]